MLTVTRGEIIESVERYRIENPDDKEIVFFPHVSAVLLILEYPYLSTILGK